MATCIATIKKFNITTCYKNDKIEDVMYVNGFKQFPHIGSDEVFVASIVKIRTLNKDVLDSEWALTSALKLVCT